MNLRQRISEAQARKREREAAEAREREADEAARIQQIKADFALRVREDFGVEMLTLLDAVVEMGSNLSARATWAYRGAVYVLDYGIHEDDPWTICRLGGRPDTATRPLPFVDSPARRADALLCALGELAGDEDSIPF